jgi:DNA ligase (NAD+)
MKRNSNYKKLIKILLEHRYRYYVLNKPIISDREYDFLEKDILKMEEDTKIIVSRYSPSKAVGTDRKESYPKWCHKLT